MSVTAKKEREQLRDQFAMAALTTVAIAGNRRPSNVSKYAYEIADAMLEERDKEDE